MDDVTKTDKMLARKDGGVGYVIFNNPERHNAVSLDMWDATSRILEGFANDEEVRVVVLTGAGGKAFVSGADISKFESERATLEATRRYNASVEKAYTGWRCAAIFASAPTIHASQCRRRSSGSAIPMPGCAGSSTSLGRHLRARSSSPRASSTPRRPAGWG